MPSGTHRILLLEDNPADADLIHGYVRTSPERFEVVHAERLADALSQLAGGKFDAILSDLHVPDSQGLATFQTLHAKFPSVPIVVLTGMNDQSAAVHALRQGAQDYIVKGSADGTRVLGSLRYAMERQRMMNSVIEGMTRRETIEATLRRCGTAHLWEAMFTTLGEGASAILYNAGHAAGGTSFDFIEASYSPADDEAFVRAFTEHFGLVKLFLVQEMRLDRATPILEARVRRNFELEVPRRTRDKPSCHFLRGLLAGTAARLFKEGELNARELECEQLGSDACHFVVSRMFA